MTMGSAEGRPHEATAADVFAVDPEIGRDLARVDWGATPLGPPAGWPQSLQTAVSILLSSRFSMWMAWGPELTFFCNSAYRRDTLGRKYPWALGRPASEVWAEIWGDIGPRIATVLTTGQATWDEALLLFLERSGYPEETYHTFSYSPLRDDDGALIGMLCVVSEDTDRVIGERRMATLRDLGSFGAEDKTLLSMLCGAMAQALHRAYAFDQQREVAVTLQRSILGPVVLPPGFAARYQPASRPLEVGGDWYDAVELPDGRIGIMVGDCVGRGLPAATIMGQLRSAGRALLLRATGPAEVLTALDQFTALLPGATYTTALCAILDPDGNLVYSGAGHPPAVLALPDGQTVLLTEGRGPSLGVRLPAPRTQATAVVAPRAVLLLYTDGLIERRRHPLDEGIRRVADIAQDGYELPVDQLADRIMHEMTGSGGGSDDVALLLYRHPAPLDMSFAAEPGELAPARAVLRAWLARTGAGMPMVRSVLVAAGEACANAIEHGHRDTRGQVRLIGRVVGELVHITVTDTGRWRPEAADPDPYRGHGLNLMRALMNQVKLNTDVNGTTVEMSTRITQ